MGLSLLLGEVIQIPGLSQQTFSIGQGDAAGATQAHLPLVALWLAHSILQRLSQTEPPTRNPTRRPECRGSRRKTPTLPYRGGFVSFGETQTVKMRDGCLEKKSPSRPPPKSQCLCETAEKGLCLLRANGYLPDMDSAILTHEALRLPARERA